MNVMSFVLFGNQSLLVQCAEKILAAGHSVSAVVTRSEDISRWATDKSIRTFEPGDSLQSKLSQLNFDWLLSISYLSVIPEDILSLPSKGAVNFHDGPLPSYAGLNAPVWARINQASSHEISWHFMEAGIDEGDVIVSKGFDIEAEDTAFSLNTKCFEAAIESFDPLLQQLVSGQISRAPQDLANKGYYGRHKRPANLGILDFSGTADDVVALVRGLDHQNYWNPLTCPKVLIGQTAYIVDKTETGEGAGDAGTVLEVGVDSLTVACKTGSVVLEQISNDKGGALDAPLSDHIEAGANLSRDIPAVIDEIGQTLAKNDAYWRKQLTDMPGSRMTLKSDQGREPQVEQISLTAGATLAQDRFLSTVAAWACGQQEGAVSTLAVRDTDHVDLSIAGLVNTWVPATISLPEGTVGDLDAAVNTALTNAKSRQTFACDLLARAPELNGLKTPDIALSHDDQFVDGSAMTVCTNGKSIKYDASKLTAETAQLLANRLNHMLQAYGAAQADQNLTEIASIPDAEVALLTGGLNDTGLDYDRSQLMHSAFEASVKAHPQKTALVFEDQQFTFEELNHKADDVARNLHAAGVGAGDIVGLYIHRSPEMVFAALGIIKSGAAYLPLDPSYPMERTSYCLEDSAAKAVISHSAVAKNLGDITAPVVLVDALDDNAEATTQKATTPEELAYLIYTSGSTGQPKGVMIEHRNVTNFFAAMDQRVNHDTGGVWLAVTSMSFDISVLEVFWSLGRGFKLVLTGDEGRTVLSNGPLPSQVDGMDISLYYWGNDDGHGRDKYKLLLEGAQFADQNGFHAIWTPERHFHAFGGPYPNPSVTGAAVAAVTRNLAVRAGSCVTPLHHTIRIAEEWAVIDNLTNGRAGLAVATGWHPNDFVIRPENTPPNNRDAMFQQIEELRQLWSDKPVSFPKGDGTMLEVMTQPRPVSKELPIWVTIAGNPETWRQAGEVGAHVLTHLLGQSIPEVEGKIKIYHQALRDNGHNPDDFKVTLMLHTFLTDDREKAREMAREPMKDYLRSAAGLVKQFAWAFPAFKRPKGVDNAFELDLGILEAEELEAILEFAFLRYFEDSGLFGTVQDALNRIEQVKKIGVTEVACLIDYGIPKDTVLEELHPLAEVVKRCNEGGQLDEGDFSIAAQIIRHKVTHLQCTPSMARMFLMNDETRQALGQIDNIMLGGEALPGALVEDLQQVTKSNIQNMYGPTETTIWSTTASAAPCSGTVPIGTPVANTNVYVLDSNRKQVPFGTPGELWIGGEGVARGYWNRAELTAERFVNDPFAGTPDARMYQTGDLVNWRSDNTLEYIGRTDFQVKLRGFRIEIGEIEAVLDAHPDIAQSAVIVRTETDADQRLIGYFSSLSNVSEAKLRSYLTEKLPPHMVPSRLIRLDRMPLTPNKKIDRKALQVKPLVSGGETRPAAATAASDRGNSSAELNITEIWKSVLGLDKISPADNFFEIGGHSLLAVQAHREIREKLHAPTLSITDIFRFPVLKDLSARVVSMTEGASSAEQPKQQPAAQDANKTEMRSSAIERRRALRAKRMQ